MIPFAANAAATVAPKIANAFEWPGQPSKIAPSLWGSAPPLIHGSVGPPESSSKTACRSIQPFCMGRKCYAVQCVVIGEENPQKCPFSLGFRHPAGGGPSHGHTQHAQKIGKDRVCGSGDRHTDTHAHRRAHHNTWPP